MSSAEAGRPGCKMPSRAEKSLSPSVRKGKTNFVVRPRLTYLSCVARTVVELDVGAVSAIEGASMSTNLKRHVGGSESDELCPCNRVRLEGSEKGMLR